MPKRLGAAAEFSSDPDNDDKDGDTDVYLATNVSTFIAIPGLSNIIKVPRFSSSTLRLCSRGECLDCGLGFASLFPYVLIYTEKRAIDCDVALVHDDDLTRMDESLRPNILTGHFRGFNPNIYQVEYGKLLQASRVFLLLTKASPEDLSSTKSCSDMVGGIVKVATLSVMLHNQGVSNIM